LPKTRRGHAGSELSLVNLNQAISYADHYQEGLQKRVGKSVLISLSLPAFEQRGSAIIATKFVQVSGEILNPHRATTYHGISSRTLPAKNIPSSLVFAIATFGHG
jgi:hypothetical protein